MDKLDEFDVVKEERVGASTFLGVVWEILSGIVKIVVGTPVFMGAVVLVVFVFLWQLMLPIFPVITYYGLFFLLLLVSGGYMVYSIFHWLKVPNPDEAVDDLVDE